ncbi:MAG: hypothetical protein AAGC60_02035 [Acidobacteriota bacterium]
MIRSLRPPARPARSRVDDSLRFVVALGVLCVVGFATSGCGAGDSPEESTMSAPSRPSPPPAFYLGGIQVHEADHQLWFDNLEAQGFNAVQVTEYAKQGDWDTDHLWWEEESPWVVEEMRGAERNGLHVALVLRVALDHAFERNQFLWHGMIMPRTDEQVDSWFAQYERFVVQWAEIAEREGVDLLMIGSEMNALASTLPLDELPPLEDWYLDDDKQAERRERLLAQRDVIEDRELWLRERERYPTLEEYLDARIAIEQGWAQTVTGVAGSLDAPPSLEQINARRAALDRHWRRIVEAARAVYSGRIGYAANFDQYHEVGFWDALDVMGVNAYFKLRDRLLEDETEESLYPPLLDGWRAVLADLDGFRAAQDLELPVVFTELGYTWRALSTLEPWADTGFSLIEPIADPAAEVEQPASPEQPREPLVIVWREQPRRLWERAVAVRALHDAHAERPDPFLRGIFYWKLSSHDYHYDDESFMVHIGPDTEEPILAELGRFVD